jgi:DNA primase
MLWRPEKEPGLSLQKQDELRNITRMKVEKARDGIYGPIRMELRYNSNTSRLEEIA